MKTTNVFKIDVAGLEARVYIAGAGMRLSAARNSANDPAVMKGLHSHFTYEIFFVTDGDLELVTDTETVNYERSTVIVPPRISHYSHPKGQGSYCLLFELGGKDVNKLSRVKAMLDNGVTVLDLHDDPVFYVKRACEKLEAALLKDAEHLIALIFSEVFSLLSAEDGDKGSESLGTKHISAIEKYINSNIGKKITLTEVADNVYLSARQVSRVVKREYGCTLGELVREKKLAAAEMLVKNTDLSISEIALQVNLGAENYFYTLYKRRYGVTPLKRRKSLRNKS